MPILLSLFDSTGTWSAPFRRAGWEVIQIDLDHGHDVTDFSCEAIIERYGLTDMGCIDAVISATPCTDFTNSGALWYKDKDADGRTAAALELHLQSYRTIEFLKPRWWALENPVGRLPKLGFQKYSDIFDPCDFAGHVYGIGPEHEELLDGLRGRTDYENFTDDDVLLTQQTNAYTKKTCLWGNFAKPERKRIEPVRVCKQGSWLMRLGGKSDRTKAARSETPEGFATAFYEANKSHDPHRCHCCDGQGQIEHFITGQWSDCPADCDEGRSWEADDSLLIEPAKHQHLLA
jgi:hypothetical protein